METCNSDKESLLIGFLCFYKGGLLLVALIICVFKREVILTNAAQGLPNDLVFVSTFSGIADCPQLF